MTFAAALTALNTHLVAAGAAITPAITDVGWGQPGAPTSTCIRYWYEGEGDSPKMAPRTLTDATVFEAIRIAAYWPVATRDKAPAAALDTRVQLFVRQVKNRLNGDSQLGGAVVDIELGNASAGWLTVGDAAWRSVEIPLVVILVDIDTIAP